MAYQMLTRTGRNFYEITSVMQNSIRKGDFETAGYCLWELLPQYASYLQKRLLVISAEDCFGVITKEILALTSVGNEESLTKALSLMCAAKKNRDADYFVCNMMFADSPTGWDKDKLSKALNSAIRKMDIRSAGSYSMELFKKNRKALWTALAETADAYYPYLAKEIEALAEANERMSKPAEETIFAAKAIVLMWTKREPVEGILGYPKMDFDELLKPEDIPFVKKVDECKKVDGLFPEYYYNWHTTYGKYTLRRDTIHAIDNDQKLLTPLEVNLFDDCSWSRDHTICLERWNPRNIPLPYNDGKITVEEKYGTKRT